ncbi:chain-length determining protein [uncultured Deefgea sp.]|uniref:chain-length determining protein n=1 Tax=uncultured Deefgea sp. TaxID=1304914 RepID=UPI002594BC9C|nr:chain-length determining protein [uncultured Deefgea sp.]
MNGLTGPAKPFKLLANQQFRGLGLFLAKYKVFTLAFICCLGAAIYWGLLASHRYVSTAHVIVQRTDFASSQAMDFGSILSGVNSGGRTDQLQLREYLLSLDMLRLLDKQLQLRKHYSDANNDIISRMWDSQAEQESFHKYFLSRVSVEYDDYAGVLMIKAVAFEPKMAQAIAAAMIANGEVFMNQIGQNLARDQVGFLEKQVVLLNSRMLAEESKLIAFQNKNKLVSPQYSAETAAGIVTTLEARLVELKTKKTAMLAYLNADAPTVVETDAQISAVEQQINSEKAKLTSTAGTALNKTVLDYKLLEGQAKLAEQVYRTALVALEKGRIEAARNIKKITVFQSASLPEYPLEPRRIYNTIVFILIALMVAGIVQLIVAIIRDHKD